MNSQKAQEKLEQFSAKCNLATIHMKSKTKMRYNINTLLDKIGFLVGSASSYKDTDTTPNLMHKIRGNK